MIRAIIHRSAEGLVQGFHVKGHAGKAPHGYDVVCAAVSAVSQTAVLGLEGWLGLTPQVVEQSEGRLSCDLRGLEPAALSRAQDILETMVFGLKAIAVVEPGAVVVEERGSAGKRSLSVTGGKEVVHDAEH